MPPAIHVARDAAVATVSLGNPGKLNALTAAMWEELARVMNALSGDEVLRCVVVRGAGREAFAAGADLEEFAAVRDNAEQGRHYHGVLVRGALEAVAACRHPVVAMIHGPCVGGGFEIACQCDLRIAGRSARFGVPVNRLGFAIAWDELAAILPVVGRAGALELLVEGRLWDAEEARAKGIVTRVVADEDLERECAATVERIAAGAPLVNRLHKRLVRRIAPPTEAEVAENFAYFATADYREGMAAFAAKRKPQFKGR